MAYLTISQAARQVGLRASAIRYYEEVGILAPAPRAGGQRRYDSAVVHRLAVVRRAQEVGFTLAEIRELFCGFPRSMPVSARWKAMANRKLVELEAKIDQMRSMQELLQNLQNRCACHTVEQCGAGILQRGFRERVAVNSTRRRGGAEESAEKA